ncbi:MAG: hypothetical protein IIB57_03450 [Planctomycetes bacterium]|nr:hypothetical protein [Planctomycetota bacterium]
MELQHINVKVYLDGELTVDPVRFIELFHRWIREKTVDGLLIDVADYRHVPSGPGVMLIGHEADYSMDNAGNRWGLLFNRKAPMDGTNEDRLRLSLHSALNACRLIEDEFTKDGPVTFSRRELEVIVNDRALAPHTPETFEACKPDLTAFFENVLGHGDFELQPPSDPRSRFGVHVKIARPFDATAILDALGSKT